MSQVGGRPTVAQVSLAALRANCRRACELVGPAVRVMAVVKADAYGHGAVAAARAFLAGGAAVLGVSTVEEGIELRRAKLTAPVVVLGGHFPGEETGVVAHDLAVALWARPAAEALARVAGARGRRARVHLKVDTGMTRLGLDLADVRAFGEFVRDQAALMIEGVFSHFASADAVDTVVARAQVERFLAARSALAEVGLGTLAAHLANSAAVLAAPQAHFSLVRPGLMLYGYAPAAHLSARASVVPAMRLVTAIVQTRRVQTGTPVGYGGAFVTQRPSTIAVLPLGYADGLHRLASNRGAVLVGGRRAPIVGRVCMDHTMIDVTDVPGAAVGDAVVVVGQQGNETIDATELAGWCETISYEVLTSVARRVPRVYVEEFDA